MNRYEVGKKVTFVSFLINGVLSIIKIVVGVTFNSSALIADGVHSLSDFSSTIIVIISMKVSSQPPDSCHPYGHGKAESIGTKLLALILIGTGVLLLRDIIINLLRGGVDIPGGLVLWIALISVIGKEILYRYTIKIGRKIESKGLIADACHQRSDALSSIGVLIGAGGARLGYLFLDPIVGLIIALFIIKTGFEILFRSINELMDANIDQKKAEKIKMEVDRLDRVLGVGDIKLRFYGPNISVDIEIIVDNQLTVVEGHRVAEEVQSSVKNLNPRVKKVFVHIDPESTVNK
ncbi:cation diffusion facilitator family transporter [Halonatronum saccharophilum]|uniref:cation diffusion facilitator family transporter n=1 Tax=Halonatronum saccharophilum TaxID=150060 RepID=UPI0004BB4F0B|nr:cation diffusion facilitator family transporter [Halonatronum saccharophilum]